MADAEIATAFILGFFEFFLVYTATTLRDRNEKGDQVPLNSWVKIILYSVAGFTAFISIQYAVAVLQNAALPDLVTRNLEVLYWVLLWGTIILFGLLVIGITYNWLVGLYGLFKSAFRGRPWRK